MKDFFQEEEVQLRKDKEFLEKLNKYRNSDSNYFAICVNIKRLLNNIINNEASREYSDIYKTDKELYEYIKEFIDKFNTTDLFRIHMRINLTVKNLRELNVIQLDLLFKEITEFYNRSIISPGEMCGVLAAQAIGEASTQLCLNTFHSSGISSKNVNLGIPRFKELINVSKNIKSSTMTCYRKDSSIDPEILRLKLEHILFKDLVTQSYIKKASELTESHFDFLKIYDEIENIITYDFVPVNKRSEYVLVFEFNVSLLESTGITMDFIFECIYKNLSMKDYITMRSSSDNNEIPTLVIYFSCVDSDKILSTDDVLSNLYILETDILNKLHLQGLQNIKKAYIEKEFKDGKTTFKCIDTEGSNLLESFSIPEIDHNKTVTNNIIEIYDILGVEAARNVLFNEIRNVISFDGNYINYRHIAMIADIMTYRGYFIAMSRHGINRLDQGTLMRCSFEETVDILTEAAAYSAKDLIKSTSENIILGHLGPFGTGYSNILFNEDAMKTYIQTWKKKLPERQESSSSRKKVKEVNWGNDEGRTGPGNSSEQN